MAQAKDRTTKEKIFAASIDLFAKSGFKDVSMREIAAHVGIKASSLYKHYESKEAILDHIFSTFKEKMNQTAFPPEGLGDTMTSMTPEDFLNKSFDKFKTAMWDPEVVKIAKIITVEQQRNPSVRDFFIRELIEKPNQTLRHAFDRMAESNLIDPADTGVLAEEYVAYVVSLYFEQNFLRERLDLDEIDKKMKQHNDFYARYILVRKGAPRK
ncbi:transcriptional regulator, TetR family [Sporobacter termitidis DSM 10068]|uniref:Transcriptional regulator, TetR family n=1 Tax=Sporobacter termitidis DSM 10068 TaxID=1123282 RepID=A0A1M5XNY0_9FIRM|nr:TetR/AcrR family transcriptional regulator [Sporobacter termitidis]SHI01555.1 transcriptional regulator, TetR family [Sporobacter termitidis DSM 10068]